MQAFVRVYGAISLENRLSRFSDTSNLASKGQQQQQQQDEEQYNTSTIPRSVA